MSKKSKSMSKLNKQMTFDSLPEELLERPKSLFFPKEDPKRQIIISSISLDLDIKRDELPLIVVFSLLPSKVTFSKLKADLWFDNSRVKSVLFDILHSFGSTDVFTLKTIFEPRGVKPGTHIVKVKLYEISSIRKQLANTVKETTVDYHPPNREERMRKVLKIKKVEGQGISIVSEKEKGIYREIENSMKKRIESKQDKW